MGNASSKRWAWAFTVGSASDGGRASPGSGPQLPRGLFAGAGGPRCPPPSNTSASLLSLMAEASPPPLSSSLPFPPPRPCSAPIPPVADRLLPRFLRPGNRLRPCRVDISRANEASDTVMALFVSFLRQTLLLSRPSSPSVATCCLGLIPSQWRGMRWCRGLVLGIIGRSASAHCLVTRSLAFKIEVCYFIPAPRFSSSSSLSSELCFAMCL